MNLVGIYDLLNTGSENNVIISGFILKICWYLLGLIEVKESFIQIFTLTINQKKNAAFLGKQKINKFYKLE